MNHEKNKKIIKINWNEYLWLIDKIKWSLFFLISNIDIRIDANVAIASLNISTSIIEFLPEVLLVFSEIPDNSLKPLKEVISIETNNIKNNKIKNKFIYFLFKLLIIEFISNRKIKTEKIKSKIYFFEIK